MRIARGLATSLHNDTLLGPVHRTWSHTSSESRPRITGVTTEDVAHTRVIVAAFIIIPEAREGEAMGREANLSLRVLLFTLTLCVRGHRREVREGVKGSEGCSAGRRAARCL